MADKWSHINEFIRNKNELKEQRGKIKEHKKKTFQQDQPTKEKKIRHQFVYPLKEVNTDANTFIQFLFLSLGKPYHLVKDDDSSRYFLFAILNYFLYTIVLFLLGSLKGPGINFIQGLKNVVAGGSFVLILIVVTFCIQMMSINRNNTIYKVFVDSISYYTTVIMIGVIQIILQLLNFSYNHQLEVISFLVVMSIPLRLFASYNDKHKFDIDVFKLNIIFIVIIIVYMTLTKDFAWLSFYQSI